MKKGNVKRMVYCKECKHYDGGVTCDQWFKEVVHSWYSKGATYWGYTIVNCNNDCCMYVEFTRWQKIWRKLWDND